MNDTAERLCPLLPPVRGLIALHNAKGKPFPTTTLERWLRFNRVTCRAEKVDLLAYGEAVASILPMLDALRAPRRDVPHGFPFSLRTDCAASPAALGPLEAADFFDAFLCPPESTAPHFDAWLEACRAASTPVRVQLQAPFDLRTEADALAARFADAGVVAVNLVLADPFLKKAPCRTAAESQAAVAVVNDLATALEARAIEANLYGVPLCLVRDALRPCAGDTRRFFMDHQQYIRRAYSVAARLYRRSPVVAGKVLGIHITRHPAFPNPIDERLLEWLMMEQRWTFARLAFALKLLRPRRSLTGAPQPAPDAREAYEAERRRAERALPPACRGCRLRRVCDGETAAFKRLLPGLAVDAEPGDACPSVFAQMQGRRRHYDAVDAARAGADPVQEDLVREANAVVSGTTPPRRFDKGDYLVENTYCVPMPGALRWNSITRTEKLSTVLTRAKPPLTISVTFGGGLADYVGFSLGQDMTLVCPMISNAHRLVLHVAADGRYVLLRDGAPVRPATFEGVAPPPLRLPSVLEPRLSIWNIDETIVTQNLVLWEGGRQRAAKQPAAEFSVVIVSTRFARRLEAVLRSIAHQDGLAPGALEAIVAYVPGLDACEDVLDSVAMAYPALRVLRSPFAEQYAQAKGRMINESVRLASGEWVVLLDSDILLAQDFFACLAQLPPECGFAAPDGRKMLSPETTAKILLGDLTPWRDWQALLDSPGELRQRELREGGDLPVGFCQCVRAACFDQVQYKEYTHFEGADWSFAQELRALCGPCTWLDGPVLHLDHGGSQWYGTHKHL